MLPVPVAPSKKGYLAFGIIFGFIIGNSLGYFIEKKSGLIFSKTTMKKLNKYPYLDVLNLNNKNNSKRSLETLSKSSFFDETKNISLLAIGKIKSKAQQYITNELQNYKKIV